MATGICYTQSSTEKRYEFGLFSYVCFANASTNLTVYKQYDSYNNTLYDGNSDNNWSKDKYNDPQQYKFSNRRPYISNIIYDGQENSNVELTYVNPVKYEIDPNFSKGNVNGSVPPSVFEWMVNEGNNISNDYKFLGSDNRRPYQIYHDADHIDLSVYNYFQCRPSYLTYQPNCIISVNYAGEYKSFYYLYPKRLYTFTIKVFSTLFDNSNKDLNSISLQNPSQFSSTSSIKICITNKDGVKKDIMYDCKNGENTIFTEKYNNKDFLSSTIELVEFKQDVEDNDGYITHLILKKDFYYYSSDVDVTTGKIIKSNSDDNVVLNLYIEPATIDISVLAYMVYTGSMSGGIEYYIIKEKNNSNFNDTDFDKWKFLGNVVNTKYNEPKYGQNLGFDIMFDYLNLDPDIIQNRNVTLPYFNYLYFNSGLNYDNSNSGFYLLHKKGTDHDYFPYVDEYIKNIYPNATKMTNSNIYSVSMRNINDNLYLYDINKKTEVSDLFNGQIKFSITWSNYNTPWHPSIKTFNFEGYPEKINFIPTSVTSRVGFAILGHSNNNTVDFHIYGGMIDLKFHHGGGLSSDQITRWEDITDQIYDEPYDTKFTGNVTIYNDNGKSDTLNLSCYIIGDSFEQFTNKTYVVGYRTGKIWEARDDGKPNTDKAPLSGVILKYGAIERSEIENTKGKKLICICFGTNDY